MTNIKKYSQEAIFTDDILTYYSRKSTGENNKISYCWIHLAAGIVRDSSQSNCPGLQAHLSRTVMILVTPVLTKISLRFIQYLHLCSIDVPVSVWKHSHETFFLSMFNKLLHTVCAFYCGIIKFVQHHNQKSSSLLLYVWSVRLGVTSTIVFCFVLLV